LSLQKEKWNCKAANSFRPISLSDYSTGRP
jgi:hypothetical protein